MKAKHDTEEAKINLKKVDDENKQLREALKNQEMVLAKEKQKFNKIADEAVPALQEALLASDKHRDLLKNELSETKQLLASLEDQLEKNNKELARTEE